MHLPDCGFVMRGAIYKCNLGPLHWCPFKDGWTFQEKLLTASSGKVGLATSFQNSKEKEIVWCGTCEVSKLLFSHPVVSSLCSVLSAHNIFHSQSKILQTPWCQQETISHKVSWEVKNPFIYITVGICHVPDMGVKPIYMILL